MHSIVWKRKGKFPKDKRKYMLINVAVTLVLLIPLQAGRPGWDHETVQGEEGLVHEDPQGGTAAEALLWGEWKLWHILTTRLSDRLKCRLVQQKAGYYVMSKRTLLFRPNRRLTLVWSLAMTHAVFDVTCLSAFVKGSFQVFCRKVNCVEWHFITFILYNVLCLMQQISINVVIQMLVFIQPCLKWSRRGIRALVWWNNILTL